VGLYLSSGDSSARYEEIAVRAERRQDHRICQLQLRWFQIHPDQSENQCSREFDDRVNILTDVDAFMPLV
jgi:hypothetical protein